jgi:hypothetical protein
MRRFEQFLHRATQSVKLIQRMQNDAEERRDDGRLVAALDCVASRALTKIIPVKRLILEVIADTP